MTVKQACPQILLRKRENQKKRDRISRLPYRTAHNAKNAIGKDLTLRLVAQKEARNSSHTDVPLVFPFPAFMENTK